MNAGRARDRAARTTVANSALGAPPCSAFGFHGPRASCVGTIALAVAFEERAVLRDRIVGHSAQCMRCAR